MMNENIARPYESERETETTSSTVPAEAKSNVNVWFLAVDERRIIKFNNPNYRNLESDFLLLHMVWWRSSSTKTWILLFTAISRFERHSTDYWKGNRNNSVADLRNDLVIKSKLEKFFPRAHVRYRRRNSANSHIRIHDSLSLSIPLSRSYLPLCELQNCELKANAQIQIETKSIPEIIFDSQCEWEWDRCWMRNGIYMLMRMP